MRPRRPHRRGTGLAAMTLVGVLASASCSSGGAPGTSATRPTRTVTDATGKKVHVPVHPQRIVALSEPTLDGALALKATVIGTTSGRGQGGAPAYLAKQAQGIPVAASVAGPNLERLTSLKPDIILTDATVRIDEAMRGKLARIAPTVSVSGRDGSWQTAFTAEARVLNLPARGRTVLAAYRKRVADIRARLGKNAHATVSIVRWTTGAPSVLLKEQPASQVVADLGLRRPPAQNKRGPGHAVPVSIENLDRLDADWMFFGTLGGAGGGQGDTSAAPDRVGARASARLLTTAEKTPGFTTLRAYRDHHVRAIDGTAWTSAGGPLATGIVLDDINRAMATGNP